MYIILMLTLALPFTVPAQEYQVPVVERSKDRVKVDGKAYYAHVVTEKQTLFSICKAYDVSVDAIYEANENLNLRTEGLKTGQVLLIPVKARAGAPEETAAPAETAEEAADEGGQDKRSLFPQLRDIFERVLGKTETYTLDVPDVINVAILLPFAANGNADEKSLDFYSGALMAARDLGNSGIKMNITALDVAAAAPGARLLEESDVIIGPISVEGIKSAAGRSGEGKYIISPLEPKVSQLVDSLSIVQTPTPSGIQDSELVKWAIEDMQYGDSLVLVTQAGVALTGDAKEIADALRASGRRYRNLSYSITRGTQSQAGFVNASAKNGTTRFIVASESETFVNDVVRNVTLLSYRKNSVALYAPSRIRSYGMIESENLHKANTHVTAGYFVDYGDPKVRQFVLAYRSLFGGEPNSFAFHGYDTLHYFVGICHRFGRMWDMKLDEYTERGLQTDFRFIPDKGDGRENTAVRRIVYSPDYKITLE